MSKAKVLLLGPLPPPYMGPSVATEILLRSALKEKFMLIHLDTNVHQNITTLGVWTVGKIYENILLYVHLAYLILRFWPGLILIPISQTSLGFFKDSVFILLARSFNRRTLLQLRGSNIQSWLRHSSPLTRAYVRFVLERTQGIVVLGGNLRHLFRDYFGDDQIYVVPNGADFRMKPRAKDNTYPRILFLSNLSLSKGLEDVLNAVYLLNKNFTLRFRLDLVGAWESAKTEAKILGLINQFRIPLTLHPAVDGEKKFTFYDAADIFVFPPREPEGHPWVIVEAMAAGLPIITTDQGAIRESVKNGLNGFIVEEKRPDQIADKIKYLIENPEIRKKMGDESRRLYQENFTEEKMVERLSFAFNSVLAK
jgi:glycosyltransferase involved in cell wall biosynthesis